MKNIIVCALLIMASCFKTLAQKPGVVLSDKEGWHKIGETVVDFKTDRDEIAVVGADKFSFLKMKVTEAPINLTSFTIYFENDQMQPVMIGKNIKSAGETRVVKIDGGERAIKKVAFVYTTVSGSNDKKARVELWGMKTNSDKKTATK
jgi:hypothetical protein